MVARIDEKVGYYRAHDLSPTKDMYTYWSTEKLVQLINSAQAKEKHTSS